MAALAYCRRLPALALACALALSLGGGYARAEVSLEYAIKATFLLKFGAFVDWPTQALPETAASFSIGILGEDPFGASLDQLVQSRMVQGRPVTIRRFKRADQVKDVQILFVGPDVKETRESTEAALRSANVLTVCDRPDHHKGIINFVLVENKVRFEIDATAAERSGLKISSKLLSLAKAADRREP